MARTALVALLLCPAPAFAFQAGPPTAAAAYVRARALLDAAVTAHGGRDALAHATRISARWEGRDHWRNQSRRAAPPYDTEPWTGALELDVGQGRMVWTTTSRFVGGFKNAGRTVIDGAKGFNANLRQRTYTRVSDRTIASQRAVLGRVPHLILLEALEQAGTLRWIGDLSLSDGSRIRAVAFAPTTGGLVTLGFDPASRLLRAIVGMQPDAIAGDAATEAIFSDYRRAGPIMVPGRRVGRVAGETISDVRAVSIELGRPFDDSLLVVPADAVELPPPAAAGEPVRKLAENVWVVRGGGYWSLVVGYEDHVLVVEAPGGGTGEVLAKIRELAPGKPVRYVIPTHHHDDHAGGMRDYIAEGATIVTTMGNRSYFERMARARPTIRPDSLARAPRPPRFELIADRRRVFSGGGPTVEIRDIGPSPHAEEMLVAWLPNEGILFQGDLLNLATGTVYPNSANATTAHFAEWLDRSGLDVKILVGVHMLPGTRAQLTEALRVSDVSP